MKSILLVVSLVFIAAGPEAQNNQEELGLPDLHKIQKITLSPSYGCHPREEVQKGYGNTALFLTRQTYNGPDLLFTGPCGGQDWLEGSTAGDDMSLIADLGRTRLEDLRTDQAFNLERVHSPELFSRFVRELPVEFGHTYAVLINKSRVRGLFYFTVTGYVPNERLDLRYTVKEYQMLNVLAQSPGFDWNMKSR